MSIANTRGTKLAGLKRKRPENDNNSNIGTNKRVKYGASSFKNVLKYESESSDEAKSEASGASSESSEYDFIKKVTFYNSIT